ncbi:DNA translocase FtsK 4TM domain-containing protein [Gammaproteobacteria bacterium]|nr:DNA translocase FtsK 4TM domain-containing protein [Gammaproteobacteria bacterium]MDA7856567.1 DNA translocase FtsK 4TM domain-containing protein [Gammaproteobacteria bacterium]MDA9117679.1 DNA translocase FtsK 4TM domain-containing protein [Gammaproteobacteria bacterium]MDC0410203.1 DNA translocase FtsK 4TM domain-containing protein [Gammaproteobacteria bacterium]
MFSPYIKKSAINFFSYFLIGLSIYIFVALVSYSSADSGFFNQNSTNTISNLGGPLGANISDFLFTLIGYSAYILLLIGCIWSAQIIFYKDKYNSSSKVIVRIASSIILLISCSSILEYYFTGISGGATGKLLFGGLSSNIGTVGGLIFFTLFLVPASSNAFNFSWLSFLQLIGKYLLAIFTSFSILLKSLFHNIGKLTSRFKSILADGYVKFKANIEVKKMETAKLPKTKKILFDNKPKPEIPTKQKEIDTESKLKEVNTPSDKIDIDTKKTKMPSTQLLDRALDDGSSLSKEELNELALLLETKLNEFGIEAVVETVLPGPVVTRFEIQPAPGTKASKITGIAQDIARSLSVSSVRVVEVIEGKSVVGIEIPNTNRKMVRLTEILSSNAFKTSTSNLTLALGHDIAGKSVVVDLGKMPHLLVAGTTGSGKSVGVNAMLLSLLFKSDPKDVRLILIDPKMLELSVYDGIPHLLTPVITDMTDASNGLRWCVVEMDRRYKLMSMMGVRNLAGFNKKIEEAAENGKQILNPLNENEEEYLETLPSIVVVVDEFADMMMLVGKKVEHLIARIAQKARAAGIHLILATQRPSVDVITGLIKANIPTRIGFQVSSKIDSRTIIDQGGAEQLLGYGDMLYLPPGVGVPIRVHGAFVGDDEVHRVVNDWKSRAEPDYIESIVNEAQETGPIPGWSGSESSGSNSEDSDELYDEAVNFVIESRRASISAVQRKLRIGYNRAARLIETMEEAGLVTEMSSNGSREVLVPKRQ